MRKKRKASRSETTNKGNRYLTKGRHKIKLPFILQNYQLRQERATHLKSLVQKSREYIESLDRTVPVTKEQVEQALVEKFALARLATEDIESKKARCCLLLLLLLFYYCCCYAIALLFLRRY